MRRATIDLGKVACVVDVSGVENLAPLFLMCDGTWQINSSLVRADQAAIADWIVVYGDAFRNANTDLLEPKVHRG